MLSLPNKNIIGLTGMSGAGKSSVSGYLAGKMGLFVIDCDMVAYAAAHKKEFLAEIKARFPDDIFDESGQLDRAATHSIIFSDPVRRRLYENILFPYIIFEIMTQMKLCGEDVLLDAPTLFESGIDMICTRTVAVVADRKLCEERIIMRDSITPESASARLSSQHDAAYFRARCDIVLENNGTAEEMTKAIDRHFVLQSRAV